MTDGSETRRWGSRRWWMLGLPVFAVCSVLLWLWWHRADQQTHAGDEDSGGSEYLADAPTPGGRAFHTPLEDDRASVTGRVRNSEGEPVAGATVCGWVDRSPELSAVEHRVPTCTQTGRDGWYRLDELYAVETRFSAWAEGFAPGAFVRHLPHGVLQRTVQLRPGALVEGIDITLGPEGALATGFVRDLTGGPVEGAMVIVDGAWRTGAARGMTVTDEGGAFSLWAAPGTTQFGAAADGYANGYASATVPGETVEVLLTPESVLVGRVVSAQTGEPVAGVPVRATARDWGQSGFSDDGGNFRIDRLRPGTYKPHVIADELYGQAAQAVHLGLGQTSEPVTIEVHPAYSVRGQVVLTKTAEPCDTGGWIHLVDQKTKETHKGSIDDRGRALVRSLMPGRFDVKLRCNGRLAKEPYEPVEITDHSVDGLTWEVDQGLSIRGRVVDSKGHGVEYMSAFATMTSGAPRDATSRGWAESTDADGAFELAGLLPGHYELRVSGARPGPDGPLDVEIEPGKDTTGIVVELPSVGRVEGVVKDQHGEPVAGAHVTAQSRKWGRSSARTTDRGEFVLEALQAGEHRVTARSGREALRAPGTSDDDIQGERVDVEVGKTARVELVVESSDGEIRGRVLDGTGNPVTDAFVDAVRESDSATAREGKAARRVRWKAFSGWNNRPVLTDTDGRFVVGDLGPGTHTVRAYRRGGGEAFAESVALGTEVELVLEQTGSLEGKVKLDGGGAPERFELAVRDASTGFAYSEEFFRTNGEFTISALPAGHFDVAVGSASGSAKTEVDLAEGEHKTGIEIVLSPRVTIRGRLVDAESGEPIPSMQVRAGSATGGMSFSSSDTSADLAEVSDATGAFEVRNVPTGQIQLNVSTRNFGESEYGWTWLNRKLPPTPEIQDLGVIELFKERTPPSERPGDLGFGLKEAPTDVAWYEAPLEVALIRPGGPAAGSGLQVGDVIVSVDGHDVTGDDRYHYAKLASVPPGTAITLGVERGESVRIVAGKPP